MAASNTGDEKAVIAVFGAPGSGKSPFISLLSPAQVPTTNPVKPYNDSVKLYSIPLVDGKSVYLANIPGFDDTNISDANLLRDIAFWLAFIYHSNIRLAGIIYLHRISDPGTGSSKKNLRLFKSLCGQVPLPGVMLTTNFWSNIPDRVGESRVSELLGTDSLWGDLIKQECTAVRHNDSALSALGIVRKIISKHARLALSIQVDLIDRRLPLIDTAPGKEIEKKALSDRARYGVILKETELNLADALLENNTQAVNETMKEQSACQDMLDTTFKEINALKDNFTELLKVKEGTFDSTYIFKRWPPLPRTVDIPRPGPPPSNDIHRTGRSGFLSFFPRDQDANKPEQDELTSLVKKYEREISALKKDKARAMDEIAKLRGEREHLYMQHTSNAQKQQRYENEILELKNSLKAYEEETISREQEQTKVDPERYKFAGDYLAIAFMVLGKSRKD